MTTVIIGGGSKARNSISNLESKSLTQCDDWRTEAENLLAEFDAKMEELLTRCT